VKDNDGYSDPYPPELKSYEEYLFWVWVRPNVWENKEQRDKAFEAFCRDLKNLGGKM
jgi:hypothetical protein